MAMDLHDWMLSSIELGETNAIIGFREREGAARRYLQAEDVAYLVCDDLRHGNIVLSVDVGAEHASDEALQRLLNLRPDVPNPALGKLKERLITGDLQFLRITPSYGADLMVAARNVKFVAPE
jgi:hypothetical protein